jgi:two-component system sensor histidine kinase MprB
MSFRLRLTVLAALAVAVAIVATSFVVYFTDRSELIGQIDTDLRDHQADALLATLPSKGAKAKARHSGLSVIRKGSHEVIIVDTPKADTPIQVSVLPRQAGSSSITPPTSSTETIAGVPSRALTLTFPRRVVRLSRSLTEANRNLAHLRWLLFFISLGGIGVAALLGAIVSRTAVAPLRRLTETADRIIETGDLTERLGNSGRDEISRLSARLDELLATLDASLRSQRQLVADASHELRTPIASLRSNFEMLISRRPLTETARSGLETDVRRELESMTKLVGELVELARGEELEVTPSEFRLDETVKTVVDQVARRAPEISFTTELEPSVVHGVPERVERAVGNLLDNARKWSPPGGTVDVAVYDGVVEVRDRGPGIALEDRPLVFNRFYRSARARSMPGAGLGLAIVKQIADAHGGSVSIDDAPGGGAILRLRLS